jgi:hypothetical protein
MGQQQAQYCSPQPKDDNTEATLVGSTNEASIIIEGVKEMALLDTGASVSTISEDFYKQHLQHFELEEINLILNIECANGQNLPYLGYVKADISIPELMQKEPQACLLLVVPSNKYNATVPVLLGTNFLSPLLANCNKNLGVRCLQRIAQHTPWYLALRCLALRERQMARHCNRIVRLMVT